MEIIEFWKTLTTAVFTRYINHCKKSSQSLYKNRVNLVDFNLTLCKLYETSMSECIHHLCSDIAFLYVQVSVALLIEAMIPCTVDR